MAGSAIKLLRHGKFSSCKNITAKFLQQTGMNEIESFHEICSKIGKIEHICYYTT